MSLVEIGQRLESERLKLGKKYTEVADEVGMHSNTYRNYETGKRDAPTSLLTKLWDLGFDVMYVVTGVYSEDLSINGGYQLATNYDENLSVTRLINLPDEVDLNSPADKLLTAMYHVEDALMQTGAVANKDYDYKDIGMMAVGLMDKVK